MAEMIDLTPLLDRIGMLVELKAKRLAPIDMGRLRASIKHRVEGDTVRIYVEGVDYARDLEYGKPPEPLSDEEKKELAEWAKRHGLPAFPIIRKIEKKGIEVGTEKHPLLTKGGTYRPFLRPALHQSIPEIKEIIRSMLK